MNTNDLNRLNTRRQSDDAHDLMPADLAAQMPALYATEALGDAAVVRVKLFTPDSSWSWYLTEYDPNERLAFGLAVGFAEELGYVSLDELRAVRGKLGLRVEREIWWQPTPLADVRSGVIR